MNNFYLSYQRLIMVIIIMCFGLVAYGQNAARDSIYLFDGNIIATQIFPGWEDSERVRHRISERHSVASISKSDVYYIYTDGAYHLISEYDTTEQLRLNLLEFKKEARIGLFFLSVGSATVLSAEILKEHQLEKYKETFDPNVINDMPKYLNYGGLGMMLIGGVVTFTSFRFVEWGSVDITPVGVRVNF